VESLVDFAARQLDPQSRRFVSTADFLVSPITMPVRYEGDAKPWLAAEWQPIYRYDFSTNTGSMVGIPSAYPYRLTPIVR
jgi:hypothetical protein